MASMPEKEKSSYIRIKQMIIFYREYHLLGYVMTGYQNTI